jgi:hypothetical protein
MNVQRKLAEIKASKTIPSEKNLEFYATHAAEHGFSVRNGFIGKLLSIPRQERTSLRFIRGSRFPLNRMPINNLRLLHKHKNLFLNSANIHRAYINKTTGSSSKASQLAMFSQIPLNERFRLSSIVGTGVPATQLPLENLRLLHKYRELFPNSNYIHRVFTQRTAPVLQAVQIKRAREPTPAMTSVNRKQAKLHANKIAVVVAPKNATRLNLSMPNFNMALSRKRINNENVQEVLRILKAYRQTKRPRNNNAPNRPTKPTTMSLNNMKRHRKELANYNSLVRNWMRSMARAWKRNNP